MKDQGDGLSQELRSIIQTGKVDLSAWPSLIPRLTDRLDYIVTELYPATPLKPRSRTILHLPALYFTADRAQKARIGEAGAARSGSPVASQASPTQSQSKADGGPRLPKTPSSPPSSRLSSTETTFPQRHPAAMMDLQATISDALTQRFAVAPPWTIQRVAELLDDPLQGNKTLGSFLRSMDTALSVASTTVAHQGLWIPSSTRPAPASMSKAASDTDCGASQAGGPHDSLATLDPSGDEAMGGALLTPIPWLKNLNHTDPMDQRMEVLETSIAGEQSALMHTGYEKSDHFNGVDIKNPDVMLHYRDDDLITQTGSPKRSASTTGADRARPAEDGPDRRGLMSRAAGAVTQGELLSLEQAAGVTPIPFAKRVTHSSTDISGEPAHGDEEETAREESEQPHARGPSVVGVEDTGPQHGGETNPHLAGVTNRKAQPSDQRITALHSSAFHARASGSYANVNAHKELQANSKINVGGFDVEKALGRHIKAASCDSMAILGRAEQAIMGLDRRRESSQLWTEYTEDCTDGSNGLDELGSPGDRQRRRDRERERSHERKTGGRRSDHEREIRASSPDEGRQRARSRRSRSLSPPRQDDDEGRGRRPSEVQRLAQIQRPKTDPGSDVGTDGLGHRRVHALTSADEDEENGMEGIERTG